MPTYIETLEARATSLTDELAALKAEADTLAADETRDAAAVDARADEIIARKREIETELPQVEARHKELTDIEVRQTNARRAPVAGINKPDDLTPDEALRLPGDEARSRAVAWIERSKKFIKDEHKENLTNLIEGQGSVGTVAARMALVTGSDAYIRGWSKYMSGNSMGMTEQERAALAIGRDTEERAGVTSGTGSSGGYFVPILIDPTMVITGAGSTNPMRRIATVKTISPAFGGWYGATAAQVTAAWTAEGSAAPDNTPTITQPNIPVYMAEAFVQVSYQAFEDISDLAGDVLALFSDAKNNLEAAAQVTGSGSSQPTGVVTAVAAITASRVSPQTAGLLGVNDPFTLLNAVPERFANDVGWGFNGSVGFMCNIAVANKIRQNAMAQNSANSVWTDHAGGVPPTLAGVPVFRSSAMTGTLTTGNDVLLVGDFSRYYIVDRIGFTTEFIPNLFDTSTGRPVAQRGWMSHWRTGANAVDTNAFRDLRL